MLSSNKSVAAARPPRQRVGVGRALYISVLLGACALGCVVKTDKTHEWVRDAASRDLSCPKGKLHVTHYTGNANRKRAKGCGKEGVYEKRCDPQTNHCTWQRVQ